MTLPADAPSTPCVKICVIDPASGLCIGCGRTGAEVATWRDLGEPERRAIMAGLPERMRAMRSRAARGRGARAARVP